MNAAVIKLDTLSDPVRSATQHHDFFTIGGVGFAFFLIGRIHVRGTGRKFTGTRVNALVHRAHVQYATQFANLAVFNFQQLGQTTIGEALALQRQQHVLVQHLDRLCVQPEFDIDDFLDLSKEPGINRRQLMYFFQRKTLRERVTDIPDALRTRLA